MRTFFELVEVVKTVVGVVVVTVLVAFFLGGGILDLRLNCCSSTSSSVATIFF